MYSSAVFAVDTCEKTHDCNVAQQTTCLQERILDYFKGDKNLDVLDKMGQNRYTNSWSLAFRQRSSNNYPRWSSSSNLNIYE